LAIFLGTATALLAIVGATQVGVSTAHVVVAGLGLGFAGLGVAAVRQRRAKITPDQRFLAWLRDHARAVSEGTALYEGVRITPDTRLVRYSHVFSVVVLTVKQPSRLYIAGVERTGLVNAAFTASTLLLGWWGIPWGPIYTIQTVFSNLGGRDSVSVGDILEAFSAQAETKPERP
jgi:hypothetical protein